MAEIPEIDPDFEPQSRPRSCTWPLPRPDFSVQKPSPPAADQPLPEQETPQENAEVKQEQTSTPSRKSNARRNAWGNLSYADLITKAIESAPDKRLTLSQIYEWMVKNVPYFKDKGDSNSSAGWKNSIRHNLSLHSRFVRAQNEGTGKSSWWMINPDATKTGKSSRRRAASMDTTNKQFEKKRGRAKKKAAELAAKLAAAGDRSKWSPQTPDGSDIMGAESPLPAFQLSPDFRPRTSSNASSCGRLSPIMANPEIIEDMHDNEVPPMSPGPLDWSNSIPVTSYSGSELLRQTTDQLTDALAETMNLNGSDSLGLDQMTLSPQSQIQPSQTQGLYTNQTGSSFTLCTQASSFAPQQNTSMTNTQLSFGGQYNTQPSLSLGQGQTSPSLNVISENAQLNLPLMQQPSPVSLTDAMLSQHDPILTQADPIISQQDDPMLSQPGRDTLLQPEPTLQDVGMSLPREQKYTSRLLNLKSASGSPMLGNNQQVQFQPQQPSRLLAQLIGNNANQLQLHHLQQLQQHHLQQQQLQQQAQQQQVQQQQQQQAALRQYQVLPQNLPFATTEQLTSMHDKFPSDIELDMFNGGFDCDVDSIIQNEPDIGDTGNMDFNLDGNTANNMGVNLGFTSSASAPTATQSWVH